MKEQYISPQLSIVCFAPVERLANETDQFDIDSLMEIGTFGGTKPSAGFDDGDFGFEIL